MSSFQIFTLVWPVFAVALVVAFGFFLVWLSARAERRKAPR